MSYSLLPYIFNSCWFISEASIQGLLPIVKSIYNGELPKVQEEDKLRHIAYKINALSTPEEPTDDTEQPIHEEEDSLTKKYISVIPVFDVITLQNQMCGPTGTYTKSKYLEEAGLNPDVEAVILFIDSPGGEAHAMFQFTNAIKDFKANYKKPIVAYIGSMAASAAYGIAACCDKIVVGDSHCILGSIGTYITVYDQVKSLEAQGIFIKEIYAADSSNKNIQWRAALEGNEKPMLAMLKEYNDRFKSIVKEGRPAITESESIKPFTGDIVFGKYAVDLNMADAIGNMNVAVDECNKLNKSNYSQIHNEQMKFSFKSAWAAIASMSIFSSKKDGDEFTEADIEQINKELEIRQQKITDLTTELSAKEAEISDLQSGNNTLQAALTETQTQLDAVNTKLSTTSAEVERLTAELATANEELTKRPGTTATTANVETEKIETGEEVKYDAVNDYVKNLNQ